MPFPIFCRVLPLVLGANALIVYYDSHSLRQVILATFAGWLLLQVAYFGSVLFLTWRSNARRTAGRAKHLSDSQEFCYHSQEDREDGE